MFTIPLKQVLTDKPTICRFFEHNEPMFIPNEPKVANGTS